MTRRLLSLLLAAGALVACSATENVAPAAGDGGAAVDASDGDVNTDAIAPTDAREEADAPEAAAHGPLDRLTSHDADVLAAMRLVAIYVGDPSDGGPALADAFLPWLLKSAYWKTLLQYGVGPGSFAGNAYVASTAIAPAGASVIAQADLDTAIAALLHASADGADGGEPDAAAAIPKGDGYVVFLPDGLNVTFTGPDGTPWQTCIEAGGYHAFDGHEPYVVMPPCSVGRGTFALSHELAEMATDPRPGHGWFTDDGGASAGEIADICNANVTVEGWSVSQLWSNADGDCEPNL